MDINNYKIVEIPSKGQGLVAKRDIKRGEQILTEEPIFAVANRTFEYELCLDLSDSYIANCLELVTKEQKEKFESLANSMNDKYPNRPNTGRFLTNNLPLQPPWVSKRKTKKSGIFLEASRVNHSCYPNSNWCWNPETGKGSLHAITDIPAETEILRSYFEVARRTMLQRQETCYQFWSFVCECPICSLAPNDTAEADKQFRKVSELEMALMDYARIKSMPQACLADALAIHRTLVDYLPLTDEFGQILYKAFEITAYHGDRLRAAGFLEGVLEICYHAEGMESMNVKYFQLLHDNLENYRFLGKSDKWAAPERNISGLSEGSRDWLQWLWRFGDEWYVSDDDEHSPSKDAIVGKEVDLAAQKVADEVGDVGIQQNAANKKENISMHERIIDKHSLGVERILDKLDTLTVEENVNKKGVGLAVKKN